MDVLDVLVEQAGSRGRGKLCNSRPYYGSNIPGGGLKFQRGEGGKEEFLLRNWFPKLWLLVARRRLYSVLAILKRWGRGVGQFWEGEHEMD